MLTGTLTRSRLCEEEENGTVQYRIQGRQEYLEKINTEDNFILVLKFSGNFSFLGT